MDQVVHVYATGLTPQRGLDVAFGDEHAQALRMATKGHRCLEFERLSLCNP